MYYKYIYKNFLNLKYFQYTIITIIIKYNLRHNRQKKLEKLDVFLINNFKLRMFLFKYSNDRPHRLKNSNVTSVLRY